MVFVVLSNRKRHCIHTPLYSSFLTNTVIVISRTRLPDYLKTSSKSQDFASVLKTKSTNPSVNSVQSYPWGKHGVPILSPTNCVPTENWESISWIGLGYIRPFIQFSGSFMDKWGKMISYYPDVQKESEVLHLVVSYV